MRGPALAARIAACLAFVVTTAFTLPASASSALDLVRQAREHETARQEDRAARLYTEALALDPTCEEAYLGLGALRTRRGDIREAERVYSVALEHLPGLRAARLARAHVRRALGAHEEAVADLLAFAEEDPATLRVLATWHGEDGQIPAQLATWRRIASRAEATQSAVLLHEARTMIRALVILVGPADPAAQPSDTRASQRDVGIRRLAATLAKRGG